MVDTPTVVLFPPTEDGGRRVRVGSVAPPATFEMPPPPAVG
ncbi:hypothetical protein ABT187_36255 [Streptomyces sp. NPDC001817]